MKPSVLLDSSFLISLVDGNRPNHLVAKAYYRHCLEAQIPMWFSTLVAAEFGVKTRIESLPLRNFRILPFNLIHAKRAAALSAVTQREAGDVRVHVKEDLKIIAQAAEEQISHILTEDASTMFRYCDRLRGENRIGTRAIKLSDAFNSGHFAPDQQMALNLDPSADI